MAHLKKHNCEIEQFSQILFLCLKLLPEIVVLRSNLFGSPGKTLDKILSLTDAHNCGQFKRQFHQN